VVNTDLPFEIGVRHSSQPSPVFATSERRCWLHLRGWSNTSAGSNRPPSSSMNGGPRGSVQQVQVDAPVTGNRACTTETYSTRKEVDIKS
jgi:hypothetical protein